MFQKEQEEEEEENKGGRIVQTNDRKSKIQSLNNQEGDSE